MNLLTIPVLAYGLLAKFSVKDFIANLKAGDVTSWLILVAIIVVAAGIGIYQMVSGKSLRRDKGEYNKSRKEKKFFKDW